jgi:hypothetical protein
VAAGTLIHLPMAGSLLRYAVFGLTGLVAIAAAAVVVGRSRRRRGHRRSVRVLRDLSSAPRGSHARRSQSGAEHGHSHVRPQAVRPAIVPVPKRRQRRRDHDHGDGPPWSPAPPP